jgi:hypothetical protein
MDGTVDGPVVSGPKSTLSGHPCTRPNLHRSIPAWARPIIVAHANPQNI